MIPFTYSRAQDVPGAIKAGAVAQARYLGGGTNLIDLMRESIETPEALVDVTALPQGIETRADGSMLIGAAVKNTALAADFTVRRRYPMLSRAILSGASGQIRNMATVGGNILQRTRCLYFYDDAARCNKRSPGAGCDAVGGFNRMNAVLGTSPGCVAAHPSDMCVALAALDAVLLLEGKDGARRVNFLDFHRLPGDRPDIETVLQPSELIVAVEIPALPLAARSTYRKIRDRASYAFALVSAAAALDVAEDGTVRDVRLALGGVGTKPWRALAAEAALRGRQANVDAFREAAEIELKDAVGLSGNHFKIELAKRAITATLSQLAEKNP